MKTHQFLLSTALMLGLSSPAFAEGPTLTIQNFIGKITIQTEPDIPLSVLQQKRSSEVDIANTSSGLVIDGGIDELRGTKCKGYYGNLSWSWTGKKESHSNFGGYEDLDRYPALTIAAPQNTHLVIENSIPFGQVEDIGSADVSISHCGRLTMENVAGDAGFNISGSGDLQVGDVQNLTARIRGSGDIEAGNVAGDAQLRISGSGDITMGDAETADLGVSGSGDIEIARIAERLNIQSSGSGDVIVEGSYGKLIYSSRGSGDLSVDEVNGEVEVETGGSGDVDIDDGELSYLKIRATGASDVEFDGTAKNADLRARGASDIYVYEVTGTLERSESGAADISVRRDN